MYAVVAPGLRGIYSDYKAIQTILALYPFTKFRKFRTEEECWQFLDRNTNKYGIEDITNFGEVFDRHHVRMEYFIREPNIYYNFDTTGIGTLRIISEEAVVENRTHLIKAMLPNVIVQNNLITGHIVAIYRGLRLIGEFVDVEVVVPDHSIFYAIHSYTGKNRTINRLQQYLRTRLGKVSITLRR